MGIDATMFVRYISRTKPTDEQLKLWSWDLCRMVGADNFFINPDEGRPALFLSRAYDDSGNEIETKAGKEWHQDGDTLYAKKDEWFVEVNLWTRYYGPDYERGNWQIICATAEWLEQNVGGEVWYGGDSSGVCVTLFDEKARKELKMHALSVHGRDYFNRFDEGQFKTPPPCGLCVKERGMTRHGWGNNYIAVSCGGCGRNFETRDNGLTWKKKEKE